jgi:tricorn protease
MHIRWLAVFVAASLAPPASAQTKLLRFPDIHGETVVFSYAGDLWKAPATGGTAVRLTAHPGQELFARFSPDGQWIAFTGQYDGDEQVYVIPAAGGEPKQLTWYPAQGPLPPRGGVDNQVYGWTPDGKRVLFRSLRDADGGRTETALYTVAVDGGLPVRLPMPTAGAGDYSPDGTQLVYSPLFRDFRTWKRYEGGWAQNLYVYTLASNRVTPVAHSPRTERDPMWIGNAIYFVSDRTGTLNLYRWDVASQGVEQLTRSTSWDVRWASSDNQGRVVYELGGELAVYDTRANRETRISITVPDDGLARRPGRYAVSRFIEGYDLSPKGERAVFVARGDVFSVPVEKGPTRNLTNSSTAHDRDAVWSPDGKTIAFISDMSGEDQVYVVPQDGSGPAVALTSTNVGQLDGLRWAPDGRHLSVGDHDGRLLVVSVERKRIVEVADDQFGRMNDHAWSPDGQWLAYSLAEHSGARSLYIWGAADGRSRRVTDGLFTAGGAAWDPAGDWLYFLSDREFAPQISTVEWNFAGNRRTGIFALALRKDVKPLFPPESDEVTVEAAQPAEAAPAGPKGGDAKPAVRIDFDGLADRVVRVPVPSANIGGLAVVKGYLLYATSGAPFYGRESYERAKLHVFDLKAREASELADDVGGAAVSADGSKVLVRQGRAYKLFDIKPKATAKTVSTADLYVDRVPADEFVTMFNEVWRKYRDFFYVANMHGYDWKAIGERYRQLLPYVGHRADLNYVLGEMVSELNIGHTYIQGGDVDLPERPRVALPGARFALDAQAGRYRIERIFRGHNEESKYRSPLTEVGVDARVGDYVLAIDGVELAGHDNPYRLLRNKQHPVTLTLNTRPTMEGARQVTFTPIDGEANLLYLNWVLDNFDRVTKATNGRVGYLHLPDMGAPGAYEFIKWYYPQIRKEGLIVDVRSNGGGNISQWIIERLDTKLLGTRFGHFNDLAQTYPYSVFHGHMATLISETSASDGDIFPARFKKAGLGPLIGKRTWGGVVGISGVGNLLDGGSATVPLAGTNDTDGSWIIEGYGVDPDIEVTNDPQSVIDGRDPQLERAIAEVLAAMEREPRTLPKRPADPVKTK